MGHGRHRWRGGPPEGAAPRRIDGFLEPCLLLLLHQRQSHGYELLDGLAPFGFGQNPVDLSTVYRLLRHLEMHGLVTSQWDTAGHGPARRVYQITEAGEAYLQRWVADLRETDRVLHHFLQVYDKRLGRGEES